VTNTLFLPKAYLKTEAYGYAIADATKAIELDPGFVKVRRLPVVLEYEGTCR
jgi:hypothetical protein